MKRRVLKRYALSSLFAAAAAVALLSASAAAGTSTIMNTAPPMISGTPQEGQELSVSTGAWTVCPAGSTNPNYCEALSSPTYAYQWKQCDNTGTGCSAIATNATSASYVPTPGDVGHELEAVVTVTVTSAGGASGSATAGPTAVITPVTPPSASLAAPVFGSSAGLSPVSGTVRIKLPGSSTFTLLSSPIDVPLGSTIDARFGKVSLTVELRNGKFETGQFFGGEFILTQSPNGTLIATLTGGDFAGCPAPPKAGKANARAARATAHKKPTTVIRQLWGNAHGKYETKGRYGSASVSGTIWLTQDRCDGTYVRVTKDNVIVVAYAHPHRKHNIHKGHHILIRAPGY